MLLILSMLLSLLGTSTVSFPVTVNYNVSHCYNSSSYAHNSTFETNFNHLLSTLVSQISTAKNSFLTHKQGLDNQDPVYGLALCRGDLYPKECHDCIQMASNQIKNFCPRATQAILWKEPCMIRYSGHSFFSHLEEQPSRSLYNSNNITDLKDDWVTALQNSFNEVTFRAASNKSGNLYATDEVPLSPLNRNVYSLAQCTPDLSKEICFQCLTAAVSQFIGKYNWGAIMLMPSCTLPYEVYKFFHTVNSPTSMAPQNNLRQFRGKKATRRVVAIIVPIIVLGMLIITSICFYIKKTKKHSSPDVKNVLGDLTTAESLVFELKTLEAATNNFSGNQMLGQGGFGRVYKMHKSTEN